MDSSAVRRFMERLSGLTLVGGTSDDDDAKSDGSSGDRRRLPIDVVVVQVMLTRAFKLPPDVVQAMLDFAEYWACSSTELDFTQLISRSGFIIHGSRSDNDENKFLLRSSPIGLTGVNAKHSTYRRRTAKPRPLVEEHSSSYFSHSVKYPTPLLSNPVRQIVFTIRSRDQGWANERSENGLYEHSSTWFEAGLERFDSSQTCGPECQDDVQHNGHPPTFPVCSLRSIHPVVEKTAPTSEFYKYSHQLHGDHQHLVQRNRLASNEWADHTVTWSYLDDDKPEDPVAAGQLEFDGRGRATGDGAFVRNLKMGDVVTLWAMARFQSWSNRIAFVKMDIYWAV